MALQIRRGTDAERTAGGGVVFANGELVYVTDTDKLYIGDGATAGGMPMAGSAIASIGEYIVADTINSTLDLQQNLDLNGKDIIGTGNINIAGTITATGNINLGDDASADTVNLAAQITSSLTPNADSTYNIGTQTARWNNGYFTGLVVDGQVDAVAVNANVVADDSSVMVNVSNNIFTGAFAGNVTGNVLGDLTGDSAGTHTGAVVGNAAGDHTGTFTGNVFTALIDSADSSAITVTPAVVMSSDLTVDNAVSIGGITGVVINDNNIDAYSASNPTKLAINSICADANDYTTELVIDSNVNVTNDMTVTGKLQAFGERAITAIHRTALSETNSGFFVTEYAGSVTDPAELQDISNYTIKTKIVEDVADFGTAVKFASMTTTQRNALTAAAGMVVFNTTDTKLQVYTGSAWADLH